MWSVHLHNPHGQRVHTWYAVQMEWIGLSLQSVHALVVENSTITANSLQVTYFGDPIWEAYFGGNYSTSNGTFTIPAGEIRLVVDQVGKNIMTALERHTTTPPTPEAINDAITGLRVIEKELHGKVLQP